MDVFWASAANNPQLKLPVVKAERTWLGGNDWIRSLTGWWSGSAGTHIALCHPEVLSSIAGTLSLSSTSVRTYLDRCLRTRRAYFNSRKALQVKSIALFSCRSRLLLESSATSITPSRTYTSAETSANSRVLSNVRNSLPNHTNRRHQKQCINILQIGFQVIFSAPESALTASSYGALSKSILCQTPFDEASWL